MVVDAAQPSRGLARNAPPFTVVVIDDINGNHFGAPT